jgi:hypothetical protein
MVENEARRAAIRQCFEACNKRRYRCRRPTALRSMRSSSRGLDDAPCQIAVFSDRSTAQAGLGRLTMPGLVARRQRRAYPLACRAGRRDRHGVGLDPEPSPPSRRAPDWVFIGHLCVHAIGQKTIPGARRLAGAPPPPKAWCSTADAMSFPRRIDGSPGKCGDDEFPVGGTSLDPWPINRLSERERGYRERTREGGLVRKTVLFILAALMAACLLALPPTRPARWCGGIASGSPCAPAAGRCSNAAPAPIGGPAPAASAAGAMSACGGLISRCCRAAPASSVGWASPVDCLSCPRGGINLGDGN